MRRKCLMLLAVIACLTGFALNVSAAVIDFESLAHNDDLITQHGAVYEEDGFRLTNTAVDDPQFATLGTQDASYTGSTALMNDNWGGLTILTQIGGGTFNLLSIALSELYDTLYAFDVVFTAVLANGQTVVKTVTLDGILGMQTFDFAGAFTDVVSVSWTQPDELISFDNIAVPEPASLLLLSMGLAGLAGFRKRFSRG